MPGVDYPRRLRVNKAELSARIQRAPQEGGLAKNGDVQRSVGAGGECAGGRVLILTADAGLGHRSAAEAVAKALRIQCPSDWQIDIANPLDDHRVPALLREGQSGYDELVRRAPELYRLGYEVSDSAAGAAVIDSALTVMLFRVLLDALKTYRPDIIVCTHPLYQAPLRAIADTDGKRARLITVVTDLATVHGVWFNKAADVLAVPTEAVSKLAVAHGFPAERVRVTGLPVDPSLADAPRDVRALRADLGWDPDLPTFLVVGSRRLTRLPEMLRAVNHSGLGLQLILMAGDDQALRASYDETEWHLPVRKYGFVDRMPTFMHAANGIISKAGGLIVSESLACGLPMILVRALPGQEVGNAEYVVEGGAGDVAHDALALLETLYHWLADDGALLATRAANACRLGRPRAALEVADLVLGLL